MTEQTAQPKRVRIEVSTSVKGVHTYSCTVELTETDDGTPALRMRAMEESKALVADLDRLYPAAQA